MSQGRGPPPRGSGPGGGRPYRPRASRRTPANRPGGRPGVGGARSRARAAAAIRPRLTSRAAVLVLVLAALMFSYASSLRAFVEQRQHIGSLRSSIEKSEQDIAALEREKKRWADDAYVVSQARARFAFGFPGEIGYQVLDADGKPLDHEDSLSAPKTLVDDEPEWWETTLDSIETAGYPPPEDSGPAEKITAPQPPQSEQ
jgi:cell division protein FtsB